MTKRLRTGSQVVGAGPAFSFAGIIQGALLSFVVTLCGSVLMSIVVMLLDWEKNVSLTMQSFNYISIGLGGIYAGRRAKRLGWLHGGLVGLIYFVILSYGLTDMAPGLYSTAWLSRLGIAFLVGAVGGMLGVNT